MHPTHTSYATKSFSLCDPILPFTGHVTGEVDPTILCFDYHSKFGCIWIRMYYKFSGKLWICKWTVFEVITDESISQDILSLIAIKGL